MSYKEISAMCAKSLQSCPTLCDTMHCSPIGRAAMPSSRGTSWCRERTYFSKVSWIGLRVVYHGTTWQAQGRDVKVMLQLWQDYSLTASCPWNSAGKNTGVGSHSLLQGIILTQGPNPGLSYCRHILYLLGYQGSPMPMDKTNILCSSVRNPYVSTLEIELSDSDVLPI